MRGDSCRWRPLRCLAGVVGFIALFAFLIGLAGPAYADEHCSVGVDIQKSTNGQDADTAPGPTLNVGDPVTWEYVVTNTGTCDLTNISVQDWPFGDFTQAVPVPGCSTALLQPGDSISCQLVGTVQAGQYMNKGVVSTRQGIKDVDPSHYFGGDAPFCGDGVVDPGEECDDGNTNNNDACRNDCTIPVCGDGIVDPGEQCDDGNTNDNDGCRNDCTSPACGDGIVDSGEQCDDGNTNNDDACRNDCTIPVCGDGIVDSGEECDDGNTNNNDACRNDCTTPFCGDGIVDAGEQCDDGNTNNDDACRNDCTIPVCGDGILDAGEECDDGNNVDGDGCSAECTVEEEPGSCRYTGGGVDTDGNWDHTNTASGKTCRNSASCAEEEGVDRYQFGGQGGAPTASQPQPSGEWTHHQQQGPSGSFTFHGGTSSAPPGTEIDKIQCMDEGYCIQARPAPFKQLDMWGIGTFKNLGNGQSRPVWYGDCLGMSCTPLDVTVDEEGGGRNFRGTFHWFEVNVDDTGEPGSNNQGAPEGCPVLGFGMRGSQDRVSEEQCGLCPDFYRIRIYDGVNADDLAAFRNPDGTFNPAGIALLKEKALIYEAFGYIDGGNLQIHPAIR